MVASDYLELADMYLKNNQATEAIQWAKKAELLSLSHANSLKVAAAYETLAHAYEKAGDDKNASLYFKKLLLQKDSLADDRYNQSMAEMQVQFETQKKTAENLELKKENLETKLSNSNQQRWLLVLVGSMLMIIALGLYTYYFIKGRYKTRHALEQLNEQKIRSMAVMEAEEKERRRIAGDLHDGVCQTLAAASLQLNKARNGNLPLDKVDELINLAAEEVRQLPHRVTPELLLHYGLVKALEQAIDRLNDGDEKTCFTLLSHVELELKDKMLELNIYRCFQELANNILKHAKASQVNIHLNVSAEEILMIVEDNGTGFDAGKTGFGLGLRNMENRIALYAGNFTVDSTEGKGTTVILKFPGAGLPGTSNDKT
jgi:signal transduction histidine kinase